MITRQRRIKPWYRDMHNHEHSGSFGERHEDLILVAYQRLEHCQECIRSCAEDGDELRIKEGQFEAYDMLSRM